MLEDAAGADASLLVVFSLLEDSPFFEDSLFFDELAEEDRESVE
ncbi:MAG TPA: hypothetical protein VJ858_05990 [Acidimicrobiia bacterium]|nr:hypothetical protein [Acidimicrobiia bacterium]